MPSRCLNQTAAVKQARFPCIFSSLNSQYNLHGAARQTFRTLLMLKKVSENSLCLALLRVYDKFLFVRSKM